MPPMTENLELTRRVASMAASACVELFRAYDVELVPDTPEWESRTHMLCGVIGFVGAGVRGSCVLAGHDPPIVQSCPEGGRVNDWIGELTNQLAGRLKARFLQHHVEIALSTPIGLSGVMVRPLPRSQLEPIFFTGAGGAVLVWVEVDSAPSFELGSPEAGQEARREGEIVLF